MGVPAYFSILCDKHKGIIKSSQAKCDVFYLDFNGVIHQAAYAVISEAEATKSVVSDDTILEATWKYFLNLVDLVKPTEAVYIYVDGCAPLAKQVQQRRRRFLSMHGVDKSTILWDRNAITPGTGFMTKLNAFLHKQVASKPNIFFSGSDEHGEGEHKLFDKIRERSAAATTRETIVIYGLDADLIMLSLLSKVPHISLMREKTTTTTTVAEYQYLDVDTLSEGITTQYPFVDIESYIVLCFLLGNDFIPNIACLHMKRNGMDIILNTFKTVAENDDQFTLVKNNKIIYENLQTVIAELAVREDQFLIEANEDYLKRTPQGSYARSNIPSDHYYPILPEHKAPLARLIKETDISRWRGLYYKHLFFTNLHDSRIVVLSSRKYIEGIRWVLDYYTGATKDETWFYPFDYAPTLKDLSNNWEVPTKRGSAVPPTDTNQQLLSVLPPESVALLPEALRAQMTDINAGRLHMYPRQFKLQTYLKTMKHECCPILPRFH